MKRSGFRRKPKDYKPNPQSVFPFKGKPTSIRIKKLTPLRTLKRKAWQAVSLFVRFRDKVCVTCKIRPAEHCGHYRHNTERNSQLGGNALWYDLRNLNAQCAYCNTYDNGAPNAYAIYLEEKYGHGILEEIQVLYKTAKKWTREEIQAIIDFHASTGPFN